MDRLLFFKMFSSRFEMVYISNMKDVMDEFVTVYIYCASAVFIFCATCMFYCMLPAEDEYLRHRIFGVIPVKVVYAVSICLLLATTTCIFFKQHDKVQPIASTVDFDKHLNNTLWMSVQRIPHDIPETLAWIELQHQFNCCGVTSSEDWVHLQVCHMIPCCIENYVNKFVEYKPTPGCLQEIGNYFLFPLQSLTTLKVVFYLVQFCHICVLVALCVRETKLRKEPQNYDHLLTLVR